MSGRERVPYLASSHVEFLRDAQNWKFKSQRLPVSGDFIMTIRRLNLRAALVALSAIIVSAGSAFATDSGLSVLYSFEAPAPVTFTSALGSQPDTRPVLGPDHAIYGMTYDGGNSGTGVIYRFDLASQRYTVLHTFSALDANGNNDDGATPGVGLTRGRGDLFYGTAQGGGKNGNGTIFKISTTGEFSVLHTFSALDANGHNEDGASPLRTIVVGRDGNLYGTTRVGGRNTCGPGPNSCGVAWSMDQTGSNFRVLHQFTASEGHAASLLQAWDGFFYGCGVWPTAVLPNGTQLPSGIIFRMASSGNLEELYRFSQTDTHGDNTEGADCYEPFVETQPGVFFGSATNGGKNGTGVLFRYSRSKPNSVDVVHTFGALNQNGQNSDGANPFARLTLGHGGTLYSTASFGGTNGNGVVYSIGQGGQFQVLHTFSAADPSTGANPDGATPDFGVVLTHDNSLIGITDFGGNGSSAGFMNSGGTLYELKVDGNEEE